MKRILKLLSVTLCMILLSSVVSCDREDSIPQEGIVLIPDKTEFIADGEDVVSFKL